MMVPKMMLASSSARSSTMEGAKGVLISVAGGSDLGLMEVNNAASIVEEKADEDANIIFGTIIDDNLGDEVRVTIIATGFDEKANARPAEPAEHEAPQREQASSRAVEAEPAKDEYQARHRYEPSTRSGLFTEREREPREPRDGGFDGGFDDVDVPDFMR